MALLFGPARAEEPAPLWRLDTTHLEADRAVAGACVDAVLKGLRADCARVVQRGCAAGIPAEGRDTTFAMRQCAWRAIAAWEDELAGQLNALREASREGLRPKIDAADKAWRASLDADVDYQWSIFEGGSLAPVSAGEARAAGLARRAVQIAQWVQAAKE